MMLNTLSKNEEDYLKGLFYLSVEPERTRVGTNQLATHLQVTPASANNMLKKLKAKELVDYEKYGKVKLTSLGRQLALQLIRKHRLWETFLYEKLDFTWDEVHEVAEQLEHIKSPKLIEKLDQLLDYPQFDPHGDPIPTAAGELPPQKKVTLAEIPPAQSCRLVAVRDNSAAFLQYLTELGLGLKTPIKVLNKREFDHSLSIEIDGREVQVSEKFSLNVFVRPE